MGRGLFWGCPNFKKTEKLLIYGQEKETNLLEFDVYTGDIYINPRIILV